MIKTYKTIISNGLIRENIGEIDISWLDDGNWGLSLGLYSLYPLFACKGEFLTHDHGHTNGHEWEIQVSKSGKYWWNF